MILFFLLGGTCKRTEAVSVDLGKCVPFIGIYRGGKVALHDLYKLLVIDSMLVDCDCRTMRWSCDRCEILYRGAEDEIDRETLLDYYRSQENLGKEYTALQNESMFEAMYEKAESIFEQLSPEMFEKEGNVSTYGLLIEMLHVYILPEIKFQKKHEEAMQKVHDTIKNDFQNFEMRIETNVETLTKYEEDLAKERKFFLEPERVTAVLKSLPRDEEFIKLLLKDMEMDIKKLDGKLILLTDKIATLRSSTDETHIKDLADIRENRDTISKEKETILSAREELTHGILNAEFVHDKKANGSVLERSKSQADRTSHMSNKYEEYKRKATKIESLKTDIKEQINIKIRLSTVMESVKYALKY
ncbi:uncharacterized protein LOC123558713 [Mercenaria mercenaria]|uniref:uncharacterized protein LOC123558713 n=1 Tax=Mercenaria mercenaria TaxID=6596 RepID=UPI00234F8163|nr:uncharacterized protein LOC123558713 [Mercenaria mercenaria]